MGLEIIAYVCGWCRVGGVRVWVVNSGSWWRGGIRGVREDGTSGGVCVCVVIVVCVGVVVCAPESPDNRVWDHGDGVIGGNRVCDPERGRYWG